MTLPTPAAVLLALFCGAWLTLAVWFSLRAARRANFAAGLTVQADRAGALLAASPAMPLIADANGRAEASTRLAHALGLDAPPARLADLARENAGLEAAAADLLAERVREAALTGASFSLAVRAHGSARVFQVRGGPAPAPAPAGSVLLWFIDATEAEEQIGALRERADRLASALDALAGLIEAAPFPMWHRGPDLRLAMVNGAYVRAVEAENAASVTSGGIELIDDSEGSAVRQAHMVRESGVPSARTVPATIAGERRMMRVVEVPLGHTGVAGYAIDVEDREQARADLARFVSAQRDMLDRLSAGVAQFGRDRSLIFFNQPFARLFSLRAEQLADGPEFNRLLDGMREAGNLPEVRDYPEWKRDRGRWFTETLHAEEEDWLLPGGRHLRVVAQPLPDGGLLLIFEDRTEQLQLASARDTLLRVRTATFDNLFEAVGVFASDGRLHLWNNRFRELWQFEEEQLAAHPRIDALTTHIGRKLKNAAHASLVRELVRSATVERKQRGGRVSFLDGREFEFAAVPLPDGNALFTMLDVTASRTVEAALRERTSALEEADRLKTAFVSNMSYELRTPLTSIGGFAEMLAGGYAGELPLTAMDYVGAILESVARLGALIDDVLDLTQSDTGSLLLAEDDVDIATMCKDAAEMFRDSVGRKGIEFAVRIEGHAGRVTGDRRRLRQALENVLKNAFAYTGEGGRVLLHAGGSRSVAEITVSDNGRGIPASEQTRVFDRFNRATGPASGEESALGLGLPLAKQFIEAHGGRIDLVSEPGSGTTVTFRLPRKPI
ncbi:PAS domain-containing sensor histidine kinase [Sphingosinicella sp. BN140058]|uniref:sensor histidine kinase n=1 Tax=Sphingosinicella sp. BN140058 TaxID=1892855 RepID=UPI00101095B8|nr:PAS domain-containing sensor histidine kinase [Sphingosinicella sp. BN140058]QAY80077.1 PAS domain-containing sensor histidine kinase [Sphingosinicella sp. BN140058]